MNAKKANTKKLNLALQGGGAHGAFTWGVLDRLLEDERIDIEAISGTSAGAMNGVLLADGLMRDGTQGARAALNRFWRDVSKAAPVQPAPARAHRHFHGELEPGYVSRISIHGHAEPCCRPV